MKLSVFCGVSVDGFLARPNHTVDFLDTPEQGPHGFDEFYGGVDVVVIGRKTYQFVLAFGKWLYGKKPVVVLSSQPLDFSWIQSGVVEQMSGEPAEIVTRLKNRGFQHAYIDGGVTIQRFLTAGLIDRLVITRVPVLIGEGIPLFGPVPHDIALRHVETRSYRGGLVQSEYAIGVADPASTQEHAEPADDLRQNHPSVQPVTLVGKEVRLEPLTRKHVSELWKAAESSATEIFRWMPSAMQTGSAFQETMGKILQETERGASVAFATVKSGSGQLVGSTRFMNMDLANRRVEIGSTWIVPAWQRSAVNTEAKLLMLQHAFETWGCFRVELKTDSLNRQSRTAILRLGAKEEGTLRQHVICWDGRRRDTVYFSILDTEWPSVKAGLEEKLRNGGLGSAP